MMVSLRPLCDSGESGYDLVPFSEVADVERQFPAEWIVDAPIPVDDRFFQYVRPLVGDLTPYFVSFTN